MQEGIVRELQDRQTQLSRRLAQLQQQLFRLEDQYLEATQLRGNVVRGWEGYLDFKPRSLHASLSAGGLKKERRPKASERMFSFSSISAPIPKQELERDEDAGTAQKWAQEYAAAIAKAIPEVIEKAEATQTGSSQSAAKRQKRE